MSEDGVTTWQPGDLLDVELSQKELQSVLRISDWVLTGARALDAYPNAILSGLCERLIAAGIVVHRASSIVELRNAEAYAVSRTWEAGKDVRVHMFRGGGDPTENYDDSPFAIAHSKKVWVVTELDSGRFSTLDSQRDQGYVRHLVVPVILANGMNNAFTFVTKDPEALTLVHLAMIRRIMPALGALQEILAIHRVLHEAMRMYVGDEPHRRILAGDARRGDVSEERAAIFFADMRDFTALTSSMTPAETTALLNRYYDCVVAPIEEADRRWCPGDVLDRRRQPGCGRLYTRPAGRTYCAARCRPKFKGWRRTGISCRNSATPRARRLRQRRVRATAGLYGHRP